MKLMNYSNFFENRNNKKSNNYELLNDTNSFKSFRHINENIEMTSKLLTDGIKLKSILRNLSTSDFENKDSKEIEDLKNRLLKDLDDGKILLLTIEDFPEYSRSKIKKMLKKIKERITDPYEYKDFDKTFKFFEDVIKKHTEKSSSELDYNALLARSKKRYLYAFSYMYYVENANIGTTSGEGEEDLASTFKYLIENEEGLNNFSEKMTGYKIFDPNFIRANYTNKSRYDTITDIILEYDNYKIFKKMELTPKLKQRYLNNDEDRSKLISIGRAFDEIEDEEAKKQAWEEIFGKMIDDDGKSRYTSQLLSFEKNNDGKDPIELLANKVNDLIKQVTGSNPKLNLLKTLKEVNSRLGKRSGADIVFNENNVIVLLIHSFKANNILNSDVGHCIVSRETNWKSYSGDYSLVYYIYNFNLPVTDPISKIAIVVDEKGNYKSGACQDRNNSSLHSRIDDIFKKWENEYKLTEKLRDVVKPISEESYIEKKKSIEANYNVIKPNLSVDEIKECIKYGADVNTSNGKPLGNAIREKNLEKIKYLLSLDEILVNGIARDISDAFYTLEFDNDPISVDILKEFLNKKDFEIDLKLIKKFEGNKKLIDILVDSYVVNPDQNIRKSYIRSILKLVIKGTRKNYSKNADLGEPYEDLFFEMLDKIVLNIRSSSDLTFSGNSLILSWLADFGRSELIIKTVDDPKYKKLFNLPKDLIQLREWISHFPAYINEATVEDVKKYIDEYLSENYS